MKPWIDKLRAMNACDDALIWCETQPSLAAAWQNCKEPSWMFWLLDKTYRAEPWSAARKPIVQIAVDCAMQASEYASNDSITAIVWCLDALQRWIDGERNQDEVEAAWSAARYAAGYAARYVAGYAACDAARSAAGYAAWGAAGYAACDAARSAAEYAAEAKSLADSCDNIRHQFPKPPKF